MKTDINQVWMERLSVRLPEIRERCDGACQDLGIETIDLFGFLAHGVFPFLIEQLRTAPSPHRHSVLSGVFLGIEEAISSGDPLLLEAIELYIFEPLGGYEEVLSDAVAYMGKRSRVVVSRWLPPTGARLEDLRRD